MSAQTGLALVTKHSGGASMGEPPAGLKGWGAAEPVFQLDGVTDLSVRCSGWRDEAGEFMSYRVARKAGDLRNHVQRINLAISARDAEAAYGALLDLFIVLGSGGEPLRARMLESAKPLLTDERTAYLQQHLATGISAFDLAPVSKASVLSRGHAGGLPLVFARQSATSTAASTEPQANLSVIGKIKKWLHLN